jgi:hypothetical protein
MESKKELQVRISKEFVSDIDNVFQYGIETFGLSQAEKYENEIWRFFGILKEDVLVLRMVHAKRSVAKIKTSRRVKI